eukprot:TRINITY_DN18217_c0_g2_i1.p1 TRINITY_DN18217_c0_g2~~TRINITY_DN18217_c0_g2_i1.p1  ORF type:complete len:796 (+),score=116.14 TRINITY_DN18217_c0_g2_i1:113-2500(+)
MHFDAKGCLRYKVACCAGALQTDWHVSGVRYAIGLCWPAVFAALASFLRSAALRRLGADFLALGESVCLLLPLLFAAQRRRQCHSKSPASVLLLAGLLAVCWRMTLRSPSLDNVQTASLEDKISGGPVPSSVQGLRLMGWLSLLGSALLSVLAALKALRFWEGCQRQTACQARFRYARQKEAAAAFIMLALVGLSDMDGGRFFCDLLEKQLRLGWQLSEFVVAAACPWLAAGVVSCCRGLCRSGLLALALVAFVATEIEASMENASCMRTSRLRLHRGGSLAFVELPEDCTEGSSSGRGRLGALVCMAIMAAGVVASWFGTQVGAGYADSSALLNGSPRLKRSRGYVFMLRLYQCIRATLKSVWRWMWLPGCGGFAWSKWICQHGLDGAILTLYVAADTAKMVLVGWANSSRRGGSLSFQPTSLLLVQLGVSYVMALGLTTAQMGRAGLAQAVAPSNVLGCVPVAAFFFASKTCTVFALGYVNAGTVKLSTQLILPCTALLSVWFIEGRRYSREQWLAIGGICVGTLAFNGEELKHEGDRSLSDQDFRAAYWSGMGLCGAVILANSVGSIVGERFLKGHGLVPLPCLKAQLVAAELAVVVTVLLLQERSSVESWFIGWDWRVLVCALGWVPATWMSTLITKRFSSVTKNIMQCVSTLSTFFLSFFDPEGGKRSSLATSFAIIIIFSVWIFGMLPTPSPQHGFQLPAQQNGATAISSRARSGNATPLSPAQSPRHVKEPEWIRAQSEPSDGTLLFARDWRSSVFEDELPALADTWRSQLDLAEDDAASAFFRRHTQ